MRKVMLLSLFAFLVCCSSNTKQEKQIKTHHLGYYVYIDYEDILHIDIKCKGIAKTRGAQPVSIVSVNDVDEYMLKTVCSICCDESVYEQLKEKIKDE